MTNTPPTLFCYTSSKGRCFYIHRRTNKNDTVCFYLSGKKEGNLVPEIPEGYEVWEHPETSGVFLRKKTPCLITITENEQLHAALGKLSHLNGFKIDVRNDEITIYISEARFNPYQAMLRFTLKDSEKRLFSADRWCFKGSIDGWINLYDCKTLKQLSHLGQESFYDLL